MENYEIICVVGIVGLVLGSIAVAKFFARHPKLKSALCWILGILGGLALLFSGVGIIVGLGVGAYIAIFKSPKTNRRIQESADAYLEEKRRQIAANTEQWERKKALEKLKRASARAQAEELEKEASYWENRAKKSRTPSDMKQAEHFRYLANDARKRAY